MCANLHILSIQAAYNEKNKIYSPLLLSSPEVRFRPPRTLYVSECTESTLVEYILTPASSVQLACRS